MNEIIILLETNLIKVGIGILLFLGAYLANMGLGAWRSVKIEGYVFDWKLILDSVIKFVLMGICIGLVVIVVTLIPPYATYVGIQISEEMIETIDSIVVIGAFLTATIRYVVDAVEKIKAIIK